MYLSKESILKAYEILSKATPTILNNFSAIQYFVATDRFCKENDDSPCDSSNFANKSEFYRCVEDVVSLDDTCYLRSFKVIYEGKKNVSATVSSNFFNGSSVGHSNNTSGQKFDYPKKGPLLYALDGKVYREDSYYSNISEYLPKKEEKFALAIWLLRKNAGFAELSLEEFRKLLGDHYSSLLVNTLIPIEMEADDIEVFNLTCEPDVAFIKKEDIEGIIIRRDATISKMNNIKYLAALRTKPFMLLAGISGTGKSRIVRKLAQASVTEDLQRQYDPKSVEGGFNRWGLHKPANFELIQVKPNWHNSLEVVGYKSNIGGAHYEFTPFVEFVARAWKHQDVPFFLCLDEMNLAPVEQYFAEFLSAIESRSFEKDEYETDPIIKPFVEFGDEVCDKMIDHLVGRVDASKVVPASIESKLVERFKTKGLTLPKNLLVMGTVNMDETTFSFSRKVLDRAMSVVMNEVEYDKFFSGESERDVEEMDNDTIKLLIDRPIRGLEAEDNEADEVEKYLTSINEKLNNTPFKLGYRAANEALLYVSAARHFNSEANLRAALDEFTMMKILSRIEGDKRSIGNLLEELKEVIATDYPKSNEKLGTMAETLKNKQFVSYWT